MRVEIITGDSFSQESGPNFRAAQAGPEADLVERFLARNRFCFPRSVALSAFCQPKLESGIPDIVFVLWDRAVTRTWNNDRFELSKKDIRLLHYIYRAGPTTEALLCEQFSTQIGGGLEHLYNANLLQYSRNKIFTKPLSHIFAVKRIVAIEAKVKNSGVALSQAVMNTWFASDSFILVPRISRTTELCRTAQARGIRLLDDSTQEIPVPPTRSRRLPLSYASWQFNEWAWRSSIPVNGKHK